VTRLTRPARLDHVLKELLWGWPLTSIACDLSQQPTPLRLLADTRAVMGAAAVGPRLG
jgi:hypothetical protein